MAANKEQVEMDLPCPMKNIDLTAVLFDIDNTLTPPRLPIEKPMIDVLDNLKVPFHVSAGSDLELLIDQFFYPLYKAGLRKSFEAFVSNGAVHYHCDFSDTFSIKLVSGFDIKKALGRDNCLFLIKTLNKVAYIPEFRLPDNIKVLGDTITFRGSMVNFAPIGRLKNEGAAARQNRKNFVEFDKSTNFRKKVLKFLVSKLRGLIKADNLKIMLGGQTSFDIGISGYDKTVGVKTLISMGEENLIFIGDSLYGSGNDVSVREYIDNMVSKKACYLHVLSYHDTMKKLCGLGLVA